MKLKNSIKGEFTVFSSSGKCFHNKLGKFPSMHITLFLNED